MELFVPAVALLALIKVFVDFGKSVTNKDVNAIFTQLFAWVAGIGAVWIYAQTVWADSIQFGDRALSSFNFASIVCVGLALASAAGVTSDLIKSIDNTDSAAKPPLLPGK